MKKYTLIILAVLVVALGTYAVWYTYHRYEVIVQLDTCDYALTHPEASPKMRAPDGAFVPVMTPCLMQPVPPSIGDLVRGRMTFTRVPESTKVNSYSFVDVLLGRYTLGPNLGASCNQSATTTDCGNLPISGMLLPPPMPALTMPDAYSQPGMIALIFSGVLVKHASGGILVKGVWDTDDQGLFVPIPKADDFHQMRSPGGALTPYYQAGNNIYIFTGTSTKKSSNDLILPTPVSISGVDVATFVPGILPTLLFIAKDKNHVYIEGKPDSTIDAKTFAAIPGHDSLFKDAFHLYEYVGGSTPYEITPFDPQTISFFTPRDPGTFDSEFYNEYVKDKNGVYFGKEKIAHADASTFTVFTSPKLYGLKGGGPLYPYAKDKNAVYYDGVVVPRADPSTFVPVDNGGVYSYYYGKDANSVYEGTTTIPNLDPQTVQILWTPIYEGCGSAMYVKDATHVFYKQTLVPSADAKTFKSLIGDYGHDKNGTWEGTKFRPDLPKDFQPDCTYG